ncbi:hypothetical protein BK666_28310 [Pseudomonas frederiksbergensis]|uniref:Uncharacterized protein n=1 Tax=Pseudomonas frederiksbergensis TaxID=104087 RepID=A0A423JN94_9PSED|nr:hypothetical protein [Pseudomonas frederiksbergensis]RON39151.1 hypothetical protein BK666_28310 [Pseudomonas frederiksbergensis]
MTLNQSVFDDLWNGEKSVCFFVHSGKCFWIVDEKYNFILDAEKDYRAYLEGGSITQEQYDLACKEFRGGVLRMSAGNFPQYLENSNEKILSAFEFEEFMGADDSVLKRVEKHYLTGDVLSSDEFKYANVISSRLPKFYINFDRKIYMHLDYGRCHEDLTYSDWISEFGDFSFLIPDKERYWLKSGNDYWKLRFL